MPLTDEARRRGLAKIAEANRDRPRFRLPWTPLPSNLERPIRFLFEEMLRQQCTMEHMSRRTGMSTSALQSWKRKSQPRVGDLEAALNVLGYRLTVAEVDETPTTSHRINKNKREQTRSSSTNEAR